MGNPITAHFSTDEFASHDGCAYPVAQVDFDDPQQRTWFETRLVPLCQVLERLRTELGDKAIEITSGYRTESHNRRIGGALHSQHVAGRAADIEIVGVAPVHVYNTAIRLYLAHEIKIGGLGLYPNWVHLDCRPFAGHLCQWLGKGIGSEVA